jgi:GH15 family glucan-1,4-alpha-glucosidase
MFQPPDNATPEPDGEAAPADYRTVIIGPQGVQFGKLCWVSHEKITGIDAEQLNSGRAGITGNQYMAWVRGEDAIETAPTTFHEHYQSMTETLWKMSPSERGAIIAALTTTHIQMCAADVVTQLTGVA